MADAPHRMHPDDLQSDLDLLIAMAEEPKRDEQAIHRHLESLKTKLDKFIHEKRPHGDGDSAT